MIWAISHLLISDSLSWKDQKTRDSKAKTLLCMSVTFSVLIIADSILRIFGHALISWSETVFIGYGLSALIFAYIVVGIGLSNENQDRARLFVNRLGKFKKGLLQNLTLLLVFGSIPLFVFGVFR